MVLLSYRSYHRLAALILCSIFCIYGSAWASAFDTRWSLGDIGASTLPALGADGAIYAFSDDDHLYAISPEGSVNWKRRLGEMISTPVLSPNGTIYVSSNETLYALDSDGTIVWNRSLPGGIVTSNALSFNGTLYFFQWEEPYFYAVAPDGSLEWNVTIPDSCEFELPPIIAPNGTMYLCSSDSGSSQQYLFSFSPDGTQEWNATRSRSCSYLALSFSGRICTTASNGTIGVYTPGGVLAWNKTLSNRTSYPLISSNGTIYALVRNTSFCALSPDGNLLWNTSLPSAGDFMFPVLSSKKVIYTGAYGFYNSSSYKDANYTNLVALSLNGTIVEKQKMDMFVMPLTLTRKGIIYAWGGALMDNTTADKMALDEDSFHLYAFSGDDSGLMDCAWPCSLQNNQHTNRYIWGAEPVPGQSVKITVNATQGKRLSSSDLELHQITGLVPASDEVSYTAKLSVNGTVVAMRSLLTNVSGEVSAMTLYKLSESGGSHEEFNDYAASASSPQDGDWWITDANGKYLDSNSVLTSSKNYYLVTCIQDNGDYDQESALGIIGDPYVLAQPPADSSSSSGCMLNPSAGLGLDWLLVLLAPIGFFLRGRARRRR